MALPLTEEQRLANMQAQLAARQAAREAARSQMGDIGYYVSDAPDNTVSAPLQELNRLSQNAVMGYDPAAFKAWQAANPNGVNLSDPKYAGVDPVLLSQWAAANPHLIGAGAATFTPDRSGFTTGGGSMPTGPGLSSAGSAGLGGATGGATGATGGAAGNTGGGSAGGSMGGATGGLFQGVNVNQYQQNPYLAQMGDVLTSRVTQNLERNIMPSIRSNAIAAGGFGGSRQGVVEANALKDANQTISDALTGAYFQDFTNQMNRNLQQYGMNQGFYTNQRGQDLAQTQLGANLWQMGNQGMLGQGQGIYGLGSQQQQAPWQVVGQGNSGLGQWSGYGTTTTGSQGGGLTGALGGALAGGQLWGLIK